MNPNIQRLIEITGKPSRMVIGLMSGTSLDGLDIALCRIHGHGRNTQLELIEFETVNYTEDFKTELRSVCFEKNVDLEKLCCLNPAIGLRYALYINACLDKWNYRAEDIDLIASHGQTIYHAPKYTHLLNNYGSATLQIGDADHLAVATGIITVSDFRQKHIAAGGEGAPLAVYGDILLFSKRGQERIMLNIGGIANFTYLPAGDDGIVLSTDTGPGNTLMDAYMRAQFPGIDYDEDAAVAEKGTIHDQLLAALMENPFFEQAFPKTTGPELFNLQYLDHAKQKSGTMSLSVHDTMATLAKFTADTIVAGIRGSVKTDNGIHMYCSGGGMHNPLVMKHLNAGLPGYTFHSTAAAGINPDAKEAVLFALLANECICGEHFFPGKNKSGIPAVSMGKISFPG